MEAFKWASWLTGKLFSYCFLGECLFNQACGTRRKAAGCRINSRVEDQNPAGKAGWGLHATSLCFLYECSLSTCLTKNAVAKAGEEKQVGWHTETARCRRHTTRSSTGWFTLKYNLLSTLSSLLIYRETKQISKSCVKTQLHSCWLHSGSSSLWYIHIKFWNYFKSSSLQDSLVPAGDNCTSQIQCSAGPDYCDSRNSHIILLGLLSQLPPILNECWEPWTEPKPLQFKAPQGKLLPSLTAFRSTVW